MKSLLLSLIAFVSGITGISNFMNTQQSPERFYYAYNEKVLLKTVPNKFIVRYAKADSRKINTAALRTSNSENRLEWKDDRTVIITNQTGSNRSELLANLADDPLIVSNNPIYKVDNQEVGIIDEILVKFLPTTTEQKKSGIIKKYQLTLLTSSDMYEKYKIPANSDALLISNTIQESGLTKFSYPNFWSDIQLHQVIPNDEFFNQQVNLHNTGQVFNDGHTGTPDADIDAPEAWAVTRGANAIIVAVLDDGVTSDHPDIPNTRQIRLNGSNFGGGNANDPSPIGNSNHGNACAGLVGAEQNNNQGITGVAPNCRILPVRISGASADGIASAIRFAAERADILSCSWGYNTQNPNFHPIIREAIEWAVTNGRNGRGCVVVFAAGNSATHAWGRNGFVAFPANVNIPGVLTVGASDRNDRQADYSPTANPFSGDNQIIDVVAPSHRAYPPTAYPDPNLPGGIAGETGEVWSMDIPQAIGDNPWVGPIAPPFIGEQLPNAGTNFLAYTGRFGGTSAACPQVAGIAALILSINPNLSQFRVSDIICRTADEVGGYNYGFGLSNETGNGRANACQAVRAAVSSLAITSSSEYICPTQTFSVPNLPAGLTVTWSSSAPYVATINASTGVATRVSSGQTTITATVSAGPLSCGTMDLTTTAYVGAGNISGTYTTSNSGSTAYTLSGSQNIRPGWVSLSLNQGTAGTTYSFSIQPSTLYISKTSATTAYFQVGTPSSSGQTAQVTITATAPCGTSTSQHIFNVSNTYYYSYAPNPVTDEFTVTVMDEGESAEKEASLTAPPYEAELYNLQGKKMKTKKSEKGKARFDVRDLPAGQYTLRIGKDKKAFSAHIQIEH